MLKTVKIFLVAAVALWGYVAAFHNIVDWGGTLGAVKAATSMSTFEGGAESWQATDSSIVAWIGGLFILLSKLITAVLCSWATIKMWQSKSSDSQQFKEAKKIALAGCGVAIFMLFFGFVVVAESWFELWRSDAMRGPVLGSAFRYAGLIALIAVFVAQNDD